VYRRERMVNLGIIPYMFSKILVLGVLCFLQSAVLVYLVNLKAPFQGGIFLPILVEVYIALVLTTLAGLMLGLAISAVAPNGDRAMSFVPIVLIPQVIFSGIIFKLDSPFLQALGALFPVRWAMATPRIPPMRALSSRSTRAGLLCPRWGQTARDLQTSRRCRTSPGGEVAATTAPTTRRPFQRSSCARPGS